MFMLTSLCQYVWSIFTSVCVFIYLSMCDIFLSYAFLLLYFAREELQLCEQLQPNQLLRRLILLFSLEIVQQKPCVLLITLVVFCEFWRASQSQTFAWIVCLRGPLAPSVAVFINSICLQKVHTPCMHFSFLNKHWRVALHYDGPGC